MPPGPDPAVKIEQLRFDRPESGFSLRIPRLEIPPGGRVAVVGASGSGKTTLLHLLAGILAAKEGAILVAGTDLSAADDAARRRFRIRNVGMVFQQFELVPWLNALDNCLLPFLVHRDLRIDAEVRARAGALLRVVGLEGRRRSHPHQLSQGEQQRLALCRALVTEPRIVLADEPTGNLDAANRARVMDLMFEQVAGRGATLVMATHDTSLLDRFDEVVDFAAFAGTAGSAA